MKQSVAADNQVVVGVNQLFAFAGYHPLHALNVLHGNLVAGTGLGMEAWRFFFGFLRCCLRVCLRLITALFALAVHRLEEASGAEAVLSREAHFLVVL
jgi:hypothetical protein